MLGKFQPLTLVVGADSLAIDLWRRIREPLEQKAADDLAVFQNERYLPASHLQHCPGAAAFAGFMPEARIKKPGIVDAELAHQRIERHHFRSKVGWYGYSLAGGQNVELVGIQDDRVGPARHDWIPVVERMQRAPGIDIDNSRVPLRAPADLPSSRIAAKVDCQCQSVVDVGSPVHQWLFGMKALQLRIG